MANARLARVFWTLGVGLVGLGATGCAVATRVAPAPTTAAALEQAERRGRADVAAELRAGLAARQTFGSVAPYVPVVLPPEVRRVWVPTHENAEGELVGGHWVYVRFTDFRWFTEAPVGPLGLGGRPAPIPDEAPPPPWPPGSSTTLPALPWSDGAPPAPAPGAEAPRGAFPTTPIVMPPGR